MPTPTRNIFALSTTMAMLSARPVIVGLTGSIGMGKSTASNYLRKAGFRVHDADATVHRLYAAGGAAVAPVCGAFPGVQAVEGGIDRTKLSAGLREGRFNLKELEKIVHPLVAADRNAFLEQAASDGEWLVVLDMPVLMESMDAAARSQLLDALVVVSAPADVQRARVLARPGMTDEKLDFILSKQVADATKRAAADFVIDTGPLPSGVASFAPARAQLANCLHSLALTHAPKYAAWRVGAPLPPKPPSFIESDFTEKAAYEQWRAAQADDAAPYPEHPPVRAVSFDLDDTLFPCLPPILSASDFLATAIAEQLPRVAAAGGTERSAMRAAMVEMMRAHPLLAHDFTELRRASLRQLAATHGDEPELADEIMREFVRRRSDVGKHFYDDALPAMRALRDAGLRVGGCTNGNCDINQHPVVAAHFDFAVGAGDAGCSKPGAAPFWHAIEGARQAWARAVGEESAPLVRPCHVVHIGDDVKTDLVGALDAGCRAVLLSRPESMPRSDEQLAALPPADPSRWREVASLDEAVQVVLAWQAEAV